MNDALQLFEKILRNNSLHVTAARKTVFYALWDKEPQTIRDIEKTVASSIDRTSIYRAIELFGRLGIIHRIQLGWKYKIELSDIFVEHHHHISCLGCGKITAVHEDTQIENLISQISELHGFNQPTHQLEIQGYCTTCTKNSGKSLHEKAPLKVGISHGGTDRA